MVGSSLKISEENDGPDNTTYLSTGYCSAKISLRNFSWDIIIPLEQFMKIESAIKCCLFASTKSGIVCDGMQKSINRVPDKADAISVVAVRLSPHCKSPETLVLRLVSEISRACS